MAFVTTALSGLRAASIELNVVGNNIANANTTGFKQSRAEFADMYSSEVGASSIGNGVNVSGTTQDFSQGASSPTGRGLDVAIQGKGFFIARHPASDSINYTRAGAMSVDKNGYMVLPTGERMQGFQAVNGAITASQADINIPSAPLAAKPTADLDIDLNLDATETTPAAAFDKTDATTYNTRTSLEMYDSLGNPHILETYYVKSAANTWDVHVDIDDVTQTTGNLTFSNTGVSPTATGLSGLVWNPGGGAAPGQIINVKFNDASQFGIPTAIRNLKQDGFTAGSLNGIDIDADGIISARYSNGELSPIAQLAIANFRSPEGLTSAGNNSWVETRASGAPLVSNENGNGSVQSGALEDSNVDLTAQMVKLIGAQRSFQINAQAIRAGDTIVQTIINIQ